MPSDLNGYIPNLNDFLVPTPYVRVQYVNGQRCRQLVNVGSIGHVQYGPCLPPLVQAIREANKQ